MTDQDTWTNRELMDAADDAWLTAMKGNPLVQLPREIVLVMRVFGLLLGVAAVIGAEADAVQSILKYSQD